MKLIRLSSNTSGDFTNVFNDNIIIPKNSSIGLVSASVPLSNQVISVDDTNDLFEMRTQASHAMYDVNLVNGSYTEPSFLLEMNRALNAALDNEIEESACCQWKVELIEQVLNLQFRRGSFNVDVVEADFSHYKNLTFAANTYTKSSAGENWDAFAITKAFFTSGAGQLDFDINATTSKFALGLISEPPSQSATTLSLSDYDYVVYTDSTQANYQVAWNKGANTLVTSVPQEDDATIFIELSEGNLNLIFRNSSDEDTVLKSFANWSFQTSYHLAFNVRSSTGSVTELEWAPDPFGDTVDGAYLYPLSHTNLIYDYSALTDGPSTAIAMIGFKQKPTTGIYLGFHEAEYTMERAGVYWNFSADESLTEAVSFTDLLVEIPSLPMESFDGALKKRRPVIAYIPSLEVQNNELVYNAINPLMISLNNAYSLNLNSVHVRILTSSPQEVKIESASIVVVISN